MRRCEECGARAEASEARFCAECAAPLPAENQTEDGADTSPAHATVSAGGDLDIEPVEAAEQKPAEAYRREVQQRLADGVIDARDEAALDEVRAETGLSLDQAEEVEAEAKESWTTAADRAPATPVTLEINDAHFYMEGLLGVLDFRVTNRSDTALDDVRLEISGRRLGRESTHPQAVPAGELRWFPLQIEPELAGEHVVEIVLRYRRQHRTRTLTANAIFKVLRKNEPINQLVIRGPEISGSGKIGFGMSVRQEINEGVLKGLIRDVNDLLQQDFPASWQPVSLISTDDQHGVRLVPELVSRRPWLDRALLTTPTAAAQQHLILLTKPVVTLGRNRSTDITLRLHPRSAENDQLTRIIQGRAPHCSINLTPQGILLRDHDTTNGTWLNGGRIGEPTPVPVEHPSELEIGSALKLRITPICAGPAPAVRAETQRLARLGAPDEVWQHSSALGLRALLIDRLDDLAARERYLLLYRWVDWPTDLPVAGPGCRADAQPPPADRNDILWRLVRVRGQVWLEACSQTPGTLAGGIPLEPGSAFPATPGLTLSAAGRAMSLDHVRQIGLEPSAATDSEHGGRPT